MTTLRPVNPGSTWCRDCGAALILQDGVLWCGDRTRRCSNLSMGDRLYCEHCRCPDPGAARCRRCHRSATTP